MKKTFRALNGLRFFAALAVVCFHVLPRADGFARWPEVVRNLVLSGPMALGFFFMLSGFVLAHAYQGRAPRTSEERRSFWLARFARLYPAYLLAYLLFLPMAYEKYLRHGAPGGHGLRSFAAGGLLSLFAVQAWTPFAQAWNGPSWSLSVEAFFYFLFPFAMLPMLRWKLSRLVPVLGLLWGAMLALPICRERGLIADGTWGLWIMNNPLFWTPIFLLGIALYRSSDRWAAMSDRRAAAWGVAGLGVLLLLCGGVRSPGWRDLLVSGGAAPVLALLVLAFSHATSVPARSMGTRLLFEAGAASYVTYILQSPVRHIFELLWGKATGDVGARSLGSFGVYVAVLLGVSFAVQALVEKPAQRWILSRAKPRPASVPLDPGIEAV